MAWSLPTILAVGVLATALPPPLTAYPTPVDFTGKVLSWQIAKTAPQLTYQVEADDEFDLQDYGPVVDDAAFLWSAVDDSFLELVARPDDPDITVYLKRQIEDSSFSSGYTEFDELDKKGVPLHCSIYILVDPGFTFNSIAKTILHEFGHCLGLGHSLIPEAIMSYHLERNDFALDIDDKAALSRLYPTAADHPQLPIGCAIASHDAAAALPTWYLLPWLLSLPLLFACTRLWRR